MLDEQDYAEIATLYKTGAASVKRYREATGASLKSTPIEGTLQSNDEPLRSVDWL